LRRALITGGAGFIGSNLADRLLADGVEIVIYDDFRTGRRQFVEEASANGAEVVEADVLDRERLNAAIEGCDTVFHLQANADVRFGLDHPTRDLEQNAAATSNVLEAMREHEITRIAFSSTGSIYGEPEVFPTPEDAPFPVQTSLYGASKAAAEGMIGAYCHGLGFTGVAFRFVSVLGERYTHGHVFDFYRALREDPTRLRILGNGKQRKSYMYVGDCVEGILAGLDAAQEGSLAVFNLGTDETVIVDDSIAVITEYMGLEPEREYTGGERGWAGDSPLIHLDCARIRAAGWEPSLSIREGLERTLDWFGENEWVFEEEGSGS
jgi:UDP-glucose 4-epimerase